MEYYYKYKTFSYIRKNAILTYEELIALPT